LKKNQDLQTDDFVRLYTDLIDEFEDIKGDRPQDSERLILIMQKLTGGSLNRLAVRGLDGKQKSFSDLKAYTETMFRRIMKENAKEQVVCNFLLLNNEKM